MRIVALSDQHGFLPEIQPCDLLIVGGDVCPDWIGASRAERDPGQQKTWFDEHIRPWVAGASAVHKLLTWGNHDWCGQRCSFESDSPTAASSTALQILVDELTTVPAGSADGSISIWATPWSNTFQNWAFMKSPEELAAVYAAIPARVDILVSHQPPYGCGDRYEHVNSGEVEHLGSRELLAAIERIRPRLVICGHLHGGHGRYEHQGIPIYNVSVVNDLYQLVRPPTVIDIAAW
jgi:Icc-related predicted phosphoesterase